MRSFSMTDIGKRRRVNQDYIFSSDEPVGCFPNLYIVADGMGGHRAGDKASSYTVNRFVEFAGSCAPIQNEGEIFSNMGEILRRVNQEVFLLSMKEEAYKGMGTTFVAATVTDGCAYVINVGDSRLYLYDGELRQITQDHSLVEELVRAGALTPEQGRNHPQKNIITRAIGVSEKVEPDFFSFEFPKGSRILLCSDGLSNMVTDERLSEILKESGSSEEAAKQCIEDALFYGGFDNIAVVIAQSDDGRCEQC